MVQLIVDPLGAITPRTVTDARQIADAPGASAAQSFFRHYFAGTGRGMLVGSDASESVATQQILKMSQSVTGSAHLRAMSALPHPSASDQGLGPNLGGEDAVTTAGDVRAAASKAAKQGAITGAAGLAIVAIIIVVLFGGSKK